MTSKEVKDFVVDKNHYLELDSSGDFTLSKSTTIQRIQGVNTVINECDELFVQRRIFAGKGNFRSMPTVGAEVRDMLNAPLTTYVNDRIKKQVKQAVETNSSFRCDKVEITEGDKVKVQYQRVK